jgi:transcriptional regulator of heat shock response
MEVDFSAQIKSRNLCFASKPLEFDGFKLSDKAKNFLSAKSSERVEILASVVQNGFEAAKNFFRPKVSDFEVAIARLNKFLTSPKSELLTAGFVNLDDVEIGLARVAIAQHRLTEADFREAKAEVKVTIEQEDEEDDSEDECECENSEMEDSADGSKVCAKCGKKAKAKKSC